MSLIKWLTTLKLFAVNVEDHGLSTGERLISVHFTRSGAQRKVKKESKKRFNMLQSDADKWLVKWSITKWAVKL